MTFRDSNIVTEDKFRSLLDVRGMEVANDEIIIENKKANIKICKKDNIVLDIKTIYIKLSSDLKDDIEYISSHLCNILRSENFRYKSSSEKAKVRILSCNASLENAVAAYGEIYKVENLLRKFICLIFYPTEVMDWFNIYTPKDIENKIIRRKNENKENPTDINIYDTDFGDALSTILLQPPHEGLLEDLREIIDNKKIKKENHEKFIEIRELMENSYPKSLWDKKGLNDISELKGFSSSWSILEKHRNDIAHNKIITTSSLNEIKGISNYLIEKLTLAISKFDLCSREVDEIQTQPAISDLDEEIINKYESVNSIALSNFNETEIDNLQYWFFNTNETYAQGAYKEMLKENDKGVISIYGYGSSAKFNNARKGQKVLAYVNKKGILAVGTIISDDPFISTNVFEEYIDYVPEDEFSLNVKWEKILPENNGLTLAEATMMGYPLPVRSTFCKLYNTELARELYNKVLNK